MKKFTIPVRKRQEIISFLLSFLYLFAGGYGILFSLIGIARFEFEAVPVLAGLFLLSLLFTLCWKGQGWIRGISAILSAAILIKYIFLGSQIKNGFLYLADHFITVVNRYFNTSYSLVYQIQENQEDLILALLAAAFVILAWLSLCVIRIPSILSYMVISAPVIGGGLLIGIVPEIIPMLFWMFCGFGILFRVLTNRRIMQNKKIQITERSNLCRITVKAECLYALSAVLFLALFACVMNSMGVSNTLLSQQMRDAVHSGMTKHVWAELKNWKVKSFLGFESVASGGINGGELGNVDKFVFSGEDALIVTVSKRPKENIYLKGYIGSDYTGREWKDTRRGEYDIRFKAGNSGYEDTNQIHNLFYDICNREIIERMGKPKGKVKMRVEWKGADKKYTYLPYISDQMELSSDDFEREQDGYIKNMNAALTEYEVTYYPTDSYQKIQNTALDSYDTELGALESDYRNFVYETYRDIPNSFIPKLKEEFQGIQFSDLESASKFIIETLHERTKYNLNAGRLPQGRDFADYFLYEQQEGSCTHYATTAALMFRLFGIPARYAIGYLAPPSAFSENKDGTFTAVLKDNSAHAWPEVYIDGFGWLPQEVTPGYMLSTPSSDLTKKQEQPKDVENIKPPIPSSVSKESPQSETGRKETSLRSRYSDSYLGFFVVMAIIIILVYIAKFRRWWILKKRRVSFHGVDNNNNIKNIYHAIEDIYAFIRIPPHVEEIEPLFLEACYSNHVLTKEDCKKMEDYYDQLRRGIRNHLNYIQRFIFQYWSCLD